MLKQNPAYEWLFFIFFLTICSGCGIINGDLKEVIQYQVAKNIASEGKRQLKDQLKNGLSYDEYEKRRNDLKVESPKGNLIDTDIIVITKKGRIRFPKGEAILRRDINKIINLKKANVRLGFSFSLARAVITVDYGYFKFKFKQRYSGNWQLFFVYEVKF